MDDKEIMLVPSTMETPSTFGHYLIKRLVATAPTEDEAEATDTSILQLQAHDASTTEISFTELRN